MPSIDSQFFYSSLIPIDDPLSTGSIAAGSDARSTKGQLRPFARGDNNALEKAWLSFISDDDRRNHDDARNGRSQAAISADRAIPSTGTDKRGLLVQAIAQSHYDKHRAGFQPQDLSVPVSETLPTAPGTACCSALIVDVSEELQKSFCATKRRADPTLSLDRVVQDVTAAMNHMRQLANKPSVQQATADPIPPGSPRTSGGSEATHSRATKDHVQELKGRPRSISSATNRSSKSQPHAGSPNPTRHLVPDDGISGKPFVRVGSPDTQQTQPPSAPASLPRHDAPVSEAHRDEDKDHVEALQDTETEASKQTEAIKEDRYGRDSVEVAVGVSRLHMVSLPMLQMKPIYWSPINDVAVVMRATWFYRCVSRSFQANPADHCLEILCCQSGRP